MRLASLTALALTAAAAFTPALAQSPTPAQPRAVLICATDAATRASFAREYGAAPVFISAREALAARDSGQTWATPRCMTEREHGRYVQLSNAMAAR